MEGGETNFGNAAPPLSWFPHILLFSYPRGAGEDDSIGDDGHGCVGDNNGVGNNGGIGGFGENGLVADNESHFRCGMLNRWSALN